MKWYWVGISADVERGARLYEDTAYHFSPVWAWLLLLFRKAPGWMGFDAALRTFLTGVDVLSAWLLFRIARKEEQPGWAWKAPVLFLANPVSVWVSSVQGQFDNLSLLFLLAAVLVTRERKDWKSGAELRPGLFLFLSLAAKQVTLFHPLLWLRRCGGLATAAIAWLLPALLFIPYAQQWRAILDRLLVYSSVPRSYGFSEFVLYDARWAPGALRRPEVLPFFGGFDRMDCRITLRDTGQRPMDGPSDLARLRFLDARRAPFPSAPGQAREVPHERSGVGPGQSLTNSIR